MAHSRAPVRLRQLRYFVAAADYGSFRKAAAALSTQESSISRRIRDLEDDLGASLFQRSHGGVRLTIAGQKFIPNARDALRQIDIGVTRVASIGRAEEGILRVGIFSSLASGFLFDLLDAFGRQHPRVRVHLVDGDPTEHVAAVRNLELDSTFVTGTGPWDDCETEQLWFERVFVVLPDGHLLEDRAALAWSDIAGERFIVSDAPPGPEIHDYLVAHLSDLGRHPDIQVQKVGRDNLLSLVALRRGLTLTSEATIGAQFPGIVYRHLAGEVLPFSVVWSTRNDNPVSRRLLSIARAKARTSPKV
ncbi:MAG: LysR family transcriptional regulator [Tabrizicola sp.]|nr:LysR family transcriptional regulator [Tabrizicola sp.]